MEIAMVKITIIGWYGTETIGDRAILAGLIHIFSMSFPAFEINLGSIYPFVTERTLIEDHDFLKLCAGKEVPISIFNSTKLGQLKDAVERCDILVIGGGPLFDGYSMYLLEYAVKKAKKRRKTTVTMGCGVGPLHVKAFVRSMVSILDHSDICILRDTASMQEYHKYSGKNKHVRVSIDPAVFAVDVFKKNRSLASPVDRIAVSVRDFLFMYAKDNTVNASAIDRKTIRLITKLQGDTGKEMLLVPMHYFGVGGDDREFLNKIKFDSDKAAIRVLNEPLNTEETMRTFAESALCVGMRFHSVVFQTILCGRNIVLDYTEPDIGKIGGFLKQIGAFEHFKNNYINLQYDRPVSINSEPNKFEVPSGIVDSFKEIYISALTKSTLK